MPLFLAPLAPPVAMAIGRFIMMRGAQQAMQKYGPQMVQMALKNPKVKKLLQRKARENEEWMKKQNLGDKRGRRDPYKEKSGDVQRPIQGDEVGRVTGPRDTLNPPRVERPLEFQSGGMFPGGIGGLLKTLGNMIPGAGVVNSLMNPQQVSSTVAQKFRNAGPSAMMNLQRMHSNVGRFPGGKGGGKGAGGLMGQTQRKKRKEEQQTKRIMNRIAGLIDPQTFIDQGMPEAEAIKAAEENKAKYGTPEDFRKYRFEKNFGMGSVYGTGKELRAAGIDALPSLATSWGQYKNWDEEIWPWLQANNMDFANAPDPRIPQEEIDQFRQENPLGIRTLPPWWGG